MKEKGASFPKSFVSSSTEDTIEFGKKFGFFINTLPTTKGARIVSLCGDLGAGKTTLTKGVALAFGIKKKITSPTFVLMKRFPTKTHYSTLVHIDAYRLSSFKDLHSLEIEKILNDSHSIILIEWIKNISSKKIKPFCVVTLKHKKDRTRLITTKIKK
ncbi:MAG: ATP/GTP-binding protein [Parcubacteria group bacterium LiPW_41]|nr:MAG: ATP/GTP-binding protein [Parcubacteria group bacterium LiPW_41]